MGEGNIFRNTFLVGLMEVYRVCWGFFDYYSIVFSKNSMDTLDFLS